MIGAAGLAYSWFSGVAFPWLARFAAPVGGAFLAGLLWAGRNCEEGKLREEIAALKARSEAVASLSEKAEAARLKSEAAILKALTGYQKAVKDEIENDPIFRDCRAVPLPTSLRLVLAPPDDPSTH